MRKRMYLVLCLVCSMCLFPVGNVFAESAETEAESEISTNMDFLGTWYGNILRVADGDINAANVDMQVQLDVFDDGTASVIYYGDAEGTVGTYYKCEWEAAENQISVRLLNTAEVLEFEYSGKDNTLISAGENYDVIYEREKADKEFVDVGKQKTNVTQADFTGSWKGELVDMYSMQAPITLMNLTLLCDIADDSCTIKYDDVDGEQGEVTYDIIGMENGFLRIKVADGSENLDKVSALGLEPTMKFGLYDSDYMVLEKHKEANETEMETGADEFELFDGDEESDQVDDINLKIYFVKA